VFSPKLLNTSGLASQRGALLYRAGAWIRARLDCGEAYRRSRDPGKHARTGVLRSLAGARTRAGNTRRYVTCSPWMSMFFWIPPLTPPGGVRRLAATASIHDDLAQTLMDSVFLDPHPF